MSESTNLNMSVETGSNKSHKVTQMLTLDKVVDWIKRHEFDDYTTTGLIAIASKYPNQALLSFQKNLNVMLQRVRNEKAKD